MRIMLLFLCCLMAYGQTSQDWIQLFNGKNLDGWDVKIRGHEWNENYANTFRVENGVLKVSYDGYQDFGNRFGHLYSKQKFSHYILVVEYRFTGEQAPGGPAWAIRNSGAMLHSQAAADIGKDQDFPASIEAQFLGGNGTADRTTLNLCTPGTHVEMHGKLVTRHCVNSTSATYHGEQWVRAELVVLGARSFEHKIDERTVLKYEKPQYGGGNVSGLKAPLPAEGTPLGEGHIAMQSESHPVEFRKVELLNLKGCMDPKASNFKKWYVEPDNSQCKR
ncbi:MAG: DUF1080 domain-containing protein [Acidimicrobiia bacterium]|nr:DUF1080 domain-containing protein [Acidimicrobiia bacterium]